MTTGHDQRPAPGNQAGQQLAAVADGLADRHIRTRITRLGDTPVLTIEDAATGQSPATVSVDPDTSGPGLPLSLGPRPTTMGSPAAMRWLRSAFTECWQACLRRAFRSGGCGW